MHPNGVQAPWPTKIIPLSAKQTDQLTYDLYDLTPEEIALVQQGN